MCFEEFRQVFNIITECTLFFVRNHKKAWAYILQVAVSWKQK